MRRITIILAIILTLHLIFSFAPLYAQETGVRDRLVNIYVRVYRLGKSGINVSSVVDLLNRVEDRLGSGDLTGASNLLDEAESMVSRLEESSGDILFWMNIYRYGAAAILISIPILAYIFIPRLYLMLWFRLRRRWLVRR